MRSKAPPSPPHYQSICFKYIIGDRGNISSVIAFYKLFLSDIKVKILINSLLRLYTCWTNFIDMRSVVFEF